MDNSQSQNVSYQAGQAKGEAQEKGSQLMNQASNAAQSGKESMQQSGQQMMSKAHEAVTAAKDATGKNMNKNK